MKIYKNSVVTVLVILVTFLSCENKPSKKEALTQLQYCLSAQELTANKFNKRNPYLRKIIAKSTTNKDHFDKSDFTEINKISKEINQLVDAQVHILMNAKKSYTNTELFDATIEHIKFTKEFNTISIKFLETVEDTITSNNLDFQESIIEYNQNSKLKNESHKIELSRFYETYDITQNEIDSIMEIIRSKK